jgi:hypothetical protein
MQGKLNIDLKKKQIIYKITEIEEPISKSKLKELKSDMNGDFTLLTNAGVEIHSSEIEGGKWNGITIKRL